MRAKAKRMQASALQCCCCCCCAEDNTGTVEAEFTYSVGWKESTTPFEKRMDKYRRYQFLKQHLEVRGQGPYGTRQNIT